MTQYYIKSGRKYVQAFPFKSLNEGIVVTSAVRYALGRMTYVPDSIMNFCRDNWAEFDPNTRQVIMRDVLEWLADRFKFVESDKHDMAYPDDWRLFVSWCLDQNFEESTIAVHEANRSKHTICAYENDDLECHELAWNILV